jgi:hypothetical protein
LDPEILFTRFKIVLHDKSLPASLPSTILRKLQALQHERHVRRTDQLPQGFPLFKVVGLSALSQNPAYQDQWSAYEDQVEEEDPDEDGLGTLGQLSFWFRQEPFQFCCVLGEPDTFLDDWLDYAPDGMIDANPTDIYRANMDRLDLEEWL